ncbi:Copper transport protein CTR3 [Colletotrichum gloeosporioides]|uniref:Copper transport protein n=1 Tax=Colletotrichum gloeosporioides TaxID=474922 RepID=A0A8H4CTY9_COLGL|nr:Copper transport protein CTR3 [Colletotrichum gloeosporioides]KAF3810055.1 Copper transport protein CTR3 [Colletotrichum gloeosporioides]
MDHGSADTADCKVSMLWNWNTIDACFLSSSWQIRNRGMMAASCIGVVLLVVMLEVLRIMSKKYDSLIHAQMRRRGQAVLAAVGHDDDKEGCARSTAVPSLASRRVVMRASPVQQILRAILHAVTFGVAYVVMLLAMYFNGYIIISIIVGAGLGKYLTDWLSCTVGEQEALSKAEGIDETTA